MNILARVGVVNIDWAKESMFFEKRRSLKSCIQKPKSICVELNVRKYSHHMNTNFRRFKTLALRTIADNVLKVDIHDATSIVERIFITFCMCVSLYNGNKNCVEHS